MLLVLQTGLYLEAGSVLQTGHFRDKLTVEKGEHFLYLSHLHSISKMWHTCLLLCFVRGVVNTESLNLETRFICNNIWIPPDWRIDCDGEGREQLTLM